MKDVIIYAKKQQHRMKRKENTRREIRIKKKCEEKHIQRKRKSKRRKTGRGRKER